MSLHETTDAAGRAGRAVDALAAGLGASMRGVLGLGAATVVGAAGYHASGGDAATFQVFAYLPILAGALIYGWLGGFSIGVICGIWLLPFSLGPDSGYLSPEAVAAYGRTVAFAVAGGIAGLVVQTGLRVASDVRARGLRDEPTGLPNGHAMAQDVRGRIGHARRKGTDFDVVTFALGQFDEILSVIGLDGGDRLVADMARRLRGLVPEGAQIYRMRPGRFGVILPTGDGERFCAALERALREPFLLDGRPLFLRAAAGIARFPRDGDSYRDVAVATVAALRSAQERGTASETYSPAWHQERHARFALLSDLQDALARKEGFRLVYQPKIDLASGRRVGAEALVRWRHDARGEVSPGEFIPLCEMMGLSGQLSAIVLDLACAQASSWAERGLETPISINVSASELCEPGFVGALERGLKAWQLDPSLLEIEVTETAIMRDGEVGRAALAEVRALGVSVAVDDFGVGHASLAYLKNLPVTTLKLDRSLVRDVDTDPCDRAIASAILKLARDLDLAVVAEGVETAAVAEALRALGFVTAQGFYFSKPVSAGEYESSAGRRLPAKVVPLNGDAKSA